MFLKKIITTTAAAHIIIVVRVRSPRNPFEDARALLQQKRCAT